MRVNECGSGFKVWISAQETRDWARTPGKAWPCSMLAGKRVFAEFDSNGLLDYGVDGRKQDVDANEFNALVSDFSAEKIGPENPAYFVAIGQFVGVK